MKRLKWHFVAWATIAGLTAAALAHPDGILVSLGLPFVLGGYLYFLGIRYSWRRFQKSRRAHLAKPGSMIDLESGEQFDLGASQEVYRWFQFKDANGAKVEHQLLRTRKGTLVLRVPHYSALTFAAGVPIPLNVTHTWRQVTALEAAQTMLETGLGPEFVATMFPWEVSQLLPGGHKEEV